MTSANWKPTDAARRFKVERFDQRGWRSIAFEDLRLGDLCRFFTPDGVPMEPLEHVPVTDGPHPIALCNGNPFKNPGIIEEYGNVGWCIDLEVVTREGSH